MLGRGTHDREGHLNLGLRFNRGASKALEQYVFCTACERYGWGFPSFRHAPLTCTSQTPHNLGFDSSHC